MNCANHPDRERTAFCQNCGKPVCIECVRSVGSSIFCEPCLTARVGATAASGGFPYPGYPYPGNPQPGTVGYPPAAPPPSVGEPSPGLAALLGFIPGVGAMYNGQYAKGIVHLIVFAVLVSLASDVNGIFGLFVAGWIFYMVIEAHHTATARRDSTPLPNPFGLNDLSERLGFGKAWPSSNANATTANATQGPPPATPAPDGRPVYGGNPYFHQAADGSQTYSAPGIPPVSPVPPMATASDIPVPYYRRFPSGAIWLIILGVFFLVGDTGFFHIFHHPVFWPVFMIAGGVWIFVHRMIVTGHGLENDGTEYYRWRFARAARSAFWVVLVGFIWLLDVLGILSWSHSWPLFLIAAGLMQIFKRSLHGGYSYTGYAPGGNAASPGASSSAPTETTVPSSESISVEPSHGPTGNGLNDDPEGR
jgi:hypothetical protein